MSGGGKHFGDGAFAGVAGAENAIYSTFLKGKHLAQAVNGWDDIAPALANMRGRSSNFSINFFLPAPISA
ncbi:hypothetical protein B1812_15490 [Methylocystis bryophila]|uniref:Uncharacterized protein n=1 Tax=Methylocystis bryophila TaxID=655015 RepID=A0A1W6MXK8_9HYPH|nr:hypothetical protein B1812_15490 [Methylocystis bryophila]